VTKSDINAIAFPFPLFNICRYAN